jgi:hypothetical protein
MNVYWPAPSGSKRGKGMGWDHNFQDHEWLDKLRTALQHTFGTFIFVFCSGGLTENLRCSLDFPATIMVS